MKKYFIILSILIMSCQDDLQSPEMVFETNPKVSQIGLPVNHSIKVDNIGELFTLNSVAWEDSSYWLKDSSNVIITNSNIDTFKNSILFNYEITFWDTGRVVIPPHYINISFPDSLVPSIFKTDSSEVLITSVFDSTMTTVINDKPLKEIKFPIERLKLFAFFLLITSILYFIYLLSTRNSQKLKIRKFFNLNPKLKALKDVEKILQTYIEPFKVKDGKPKTDKELAKKKEQSDKVNAEIQSFLDSGEVQNIIDSSVSKEEAQSKISLFI